MNWHVYIYILVFSYICGWCQTHHSRWPGVLSEANTLRTWSPVPWWVKLLVHNLRWKWRTIGRVVAQHFKVCLDLGSGIAPTCCASTLGVYWTGQSEALTLDWYERGQCIISQCQEVLSTPNPGIVDEKCALSLYFFDLLGEASNDVWHTMYLG